MNDTSEETIEQIQEYLQAVKDNAYSFETDSAKADMITGKVVAGYQWSGDAVYTMDQAEKDDFVSVNALRKFAEKINHRGITSCEYVYLPGTRHETYCSDDRTMEMYLDKIMKFLDSCSGRCFLIMRC